jgi:hypothetical protein
MARMRSARRKTPSCKAIPTRPAGSGRRSGLELLIIHRTRWSQVVTGDDLTAAIRATAATLHHREILEKLNCLKVNGQIGDVAGRRLR